MNISSLTFRDLQYLIAVETYRNFTKAADACHVSQPALSTQIKKIEGYFSLSIFERQNNAIFPTAEGKQILEIAKSIYQQAAQFREISCNRSSCFETELTIGIISSLAPYYPSHFISALRETYPLLKIKFIEGYTDYLVAELKEGLIDILISSEIFETKFLQVELIFNDPFVVCMSKQHPLYQNEFITLSDLNTEHMFFLKEGNCLRDKVLDICPKNKRGKINTENNIQSIEILKNIVAYNKSYCLLPSMAEAIPHSLDSILGIKKFKEEQAPYFPIHFVYRAGSHREKDFKIFYNFLLSQSLIIK